MDEYLPGDQRLDGRNTPLPEEVLISNCQQPRGADVVTIHPPTNKSPHRKVGFFTALSTVGRLGQLVEVQGEEGHAEAAEGDEQVLGGEGHDSRYKTLLTNVTEAQGCVVKSFRGGCGQSSFL